MCNKPVTVALMWFQLVYILVAVRMATYLVITQRPNHTHDVYSCMN